MARSPTPNEPADVYIDPDAPGRLAPAELRVDADARAWRSRRQNMAVVPMPTPDDDATGLYWVITESASTYLVDLEAGRCRCPDYQHRTELCKHLRRVAAAVSETLLPAPGAPVAPYMERELPARVAAYEALAEQPDAPTWATAHLGALTGARSAYEAGRPLAADGSFHTEVVTG